MLQLPQRLGLDLPNALAGDRELLADFLQRVVGVHADEQALAPGDLQTDVARGKKDNRTRQNSAKYRVYLVIITVT